MAFRRIVYPTKWLRYDGDMPANRQINAIVLTTAIAILVAVTLACVVKARTLSDRAKCQRNLMQIGLGILNYEGAVGCLPAATVRKSGLPPERRLSWLVETAGFLESTRPFDWTFNKPWDDEINRSVAVYQMNLYQCPLLAMKPRTSELFPTTYIGISGLEDDAAEVSLDDPRAGVFGYDR